MPPKSSLFSIALVTATLAEDSNAMLSADQDKRHHAGNDDDDLSDIHDANLNFWTSNFENVCRSMA